jgi:hypothetical protein
MATWAKVHTDGLRISMAENSENKCDPYFQMLPHQPGWNPRNISHHPIGVIQTR